MLSFVNIQENTAFQNRSGIADIDFASEFATNNYPLPFQYESTEAVSSFTIIKIDSFGSDYEIISLSTSLIQSDGEYHICDGLIAYSSPLSCGTYYFLVNGKYKSDLFEVLIFNEATTSNSPISISGLEFFENDINYQGRQGSPFLNFGLQKSEFDKPLPFQYLSGESVSSFRALRLNNLGITIETISLSISLIQSDGTYHLCDGLTNYSTGLGCGIYQFLVNDKYYSDYFEIFGEAIDADELLLETGDFLLLETGYKLLLE